MEHHKIRRVHPDADVDAVDREFHDLGKPCRRTDKTEYARSELTARWIAVRGAPVSASRNATTSLSFSTTNATCEKRSRSPPSPINI